MAKQISIKTIEERDIILGYLKHEKYPSEYSKGQKRQLRRKCENLSLVSEQICYKKPNGEKLKFVCQFEIELIQMILMQEHRDGHPGITKMTDLINKKYYGISTLDIKNFVSSCDNCRNYIPMRTIQDVDIVNIRRKYDRYVIDCIDLRHYSQDNDGYCWIFNVIDSFTKFLWSFKLKNKTAINISESLKECFFTFGLPLSIQADNGKEFRNQTLHNLCSELNIQMIHGRPRHPKAQGVVERVNQTVKRWLAKILHGTARKRWIDHLSNVVHKYNTTIHRATGNSPFMLFFGQPGYNPSQLILDVNDDGTHFDENIETGDIIPYDEYSRWNLDMNSDVQIDLPISEQSILENDLSINTVENNALIHFDQYRSRVVYNANSNNRSRIFNSGDIVIIKKDFDNNTLTRRNAFESFYEEGEYEVIEILQNNMLKIKKLGGEQTMTLFKGRVKKIN